MALVIAGLTLGLCTGGPSALAKERPATTVIVDLKTQRLEVLRDGRAVLRSRVSTGSGRLYCVDGGCAYAVTPVGHFRVLRKVADWQESPLGWMYMPVYFYGGFAIHGSLSVPDHPASHGCIRVPIKVGTELSDLLRVGDQVIVRR